jgi:nitroimidazol reductase NimA-like FMN-containing flavoprotein (pyridoxamine 5'-phosphate oxidase superfamily)
MEIPGNGGRQPVNDPGDLHAQVRKTVAAVHFVVLTTTEEAAISPVFCAYDYDHDGQFTFWWGSSRECGHSRYVERAGTVTFVFAHTAAPFRQYRGVYGTATVRLLTTPEEMKVTLDRLMTRREALGDSNYWDVTDFEGGKIGLYEATPSMLWINREFRDADGTVHDRRVPVPLPSDDPGPDRRGGHLGTCG